MNVSRQTSNLSKPGSRQKKVTKRQNVDVTDPEFARAMEKELSNLDKKNVSRTSSMAANLPRLGAPAVNSPKVIPSPQPQKDENEDKKQETLTQEQVSDDQKQKKVKRRKKQENADNSKDTGEYTDDFESESDDDEISKVRSANQTFIQEQFNEELKALSEASELPELNDAEFEQYMDKQRHLIMEREATHVTWLEGFIQKKENVMARLGIVSQNRSTRFNEVCDITCRLLDVPPFPVTKLHSSLRQSRSRSQERSRERSRGRSREHSRERSHERSRGRSRERSQVKSRDRSREKSFERPAIAEDKELPAITDLKEELAESQGREDKGADEVKEE